jgi:hypothetical protein
MTKPAWPGAQAPALVELSIGELELVGFPAAQRFAIAAAVERALVDLVENRGWPSAREAEPEAQATARLGAEAAPERIGQAVAEAIYRAAATPNQR